MDKILLSVLAGLIVINTAFAVPSPEDRRKLCEKHPDKLVWVPKYEECVDKNACASSDENIRLYCFDYRISGLLPNDLQKRDLIINRFVEQAMKTKVKEIKDVGFSSLEQVDYDKKTFEIKGTYTTAVPVVGVKTQDGDYFCVEYGSSSSIDKTCTSSVAWAVQAYGYSYYDGNFDTQIVGDLSNAIEIMRINGLGADSSICRDIKDFASLLYDDIVEQDYNETDCTFKCPAFE